jgi:hypothetical protein
VQGIYHQSTGSVVNNVVYANPSSVGILLWHDAHDITIANNTLVDNGIGLTVGAGDFYQPAKPAAGVEVVNNIVFNNRVYGIQEHGLTGKNLYQNNLVYGNGSNWSLQNGNTHTGTITADPQFVSYQKGIDGGLRTAGGAPDIGAYEKGAASGGGGTVNTPPVAQIGDHTVAVNSTTKVANWLTATDANGNAITQYQLRDDGAATNSGYFSSASNAHYAANTAITVTAAELANVEVHGGQAAGTETMWVRAYDGTSWGAWDSFVLTTQAAGQTNTPPVVQVADHTVAANSATNFSTWLNATDANGNNTITQYQFWDDNAQANTAYLSSSASAQHPGDTYVTVSAADLATVKVNGGKAAGTDTMYVRAFDGTSWGAWDSFVVSTQAAQANVAPVVQMSDLGIAPNSAIKLSDWLKATDANGHAITQYQFWDDNAQSNTAYLSSSSNAHYAGDTYVTVSAAQLDTMKVHGGTGAGTDKMYVRAFDGTNWGAWDLFTVSTRAPVSTATAPVAKIYDQTVHVNELSKVKDWMSSWDANGNAMTQYQFWDDGAAAQSGYFSTPNNSHHPADVAITVAASQLDSVSVRGGQTAGADTMFVRAFDGKQWGAWDQFTLTTIA